MSALSFLHHRSQRGCCPRSRRETFQAGRPPEARKGHGDNIEFVDIAGLIKDAHKGEGLGNRFLSHIRNVDAVAHVIRAFNSGQVPHVYADIDPARDMDIVETEIIISDLEIVEDRIRKIERLAKISKDKGEAEMELLLRVRRYLEAGRFVTTDDFDESEKQALSSFDLITTKPLFYIANVDEEGLAVSPQPAIEEAAAKRGREVVYICGKLEQDLSALPEDERVSFMELYDMKEFSIDKIIHVGYRILGLITFYTVVGKEMRAGRSPGTTCAKAAGKIHTDMEKAHTGRGHKHRRSHHLRQRTRSPRKGPPKPRRPRLRRAGWRHTQHTINRLTGGKTLKPSQVSGLRSQAKGQNTQRIPLVPNPEPETRSGL